jgi:hypothetical protein
MPSFAKIYENGEIKFSLTFRDKTFTSTLGPWNNGERRGDQGLLKQVKAEYDDLPEDLLDSIYYLEIADDDEIEITMKELEGYEESPLTATNSQRAMNDTHQ